MPLHLQWTDLALRLAFTVLASAAIGFNRSEHGKAAGMRTTLLVCLAASVAMIQVNLLLPLEGRPLGSFVMNDLMRLPWGFLRAWASSEAERFCGGRIFWSVLPLPPRYGWSR